MDKIHWAYTSLNGIEMVEFCSMMEFCVLANGLECNTDKLRINLYPFLDSFMIKFQR